MKQRIYIDTSVVGGYFDEEFKKQPEVFSKDLKITKYYLLFLICLMLFSIESWKVESRKFGEIVVMKKLKHQANGNAILGGVSDK